MEIIDISRAVKELKAKNAKLINEDETFKFAVNYYRDNVLVIDQNTQSDLIPVISHVKEFYGQDDLRVLNCWVCVKKLDPILRTVIEREQFYRPLIRATAYLLFREMVTPFQRKPDLQKEIQQLHSFSVNEEAKSYHAHNFHVLLTILSNPWKYNSTLSKIIHDAVDDIEDVRECFHFEGGELLALRYYFLQQHVENVQLSLNFAKHAIFILNDTEDDIDYGNTLHGLLGDDTFFEMYMSCMKDFFTVGENVENIEEHIKVKRKSIEKMIQKMKQKYILIIYNYSTKLVKSATKTALDLEIFRIFLRLQIHNIIQRSLNGHHDKYNEMNFKVFLEEYCLLFKDTQPGTISAQDMLKIIYEKIGDSNIINWTCCVLRAMKGKYDEELLQRFSIKLIFIELKNLEILRASEDATVKSLIYAHRRISRCIDNLRNVFQWFHKEILLVAFHFYPQKDMLQEFCDLAEIKNDIYTTDDLSELPIDKQILQDLCSILSLKKIPECDWSQSWIKLENRIKVLVKDKNGIYDRCLQNTKIQERNLEHIEINYQLYDDLPEGPSYTVEPNYVDCLTKEQFSTYFYTDDDLKLLEKRDPAEYMRLQADDEPKPIKPQSSRSRQRKPKPRRKPAVRKERPKWSDETQVRHQRNAKNQAKEKILYQEYIEDEANYESTKSTTSCLMKEILKPNPYIKMELLQSKKPEATVTSATTDGSEQSNASSRSPLLKVTYKVLPPNQPTPSTSKSLKHQ